VFFLLSAVVVSAFVAPGSGKSGQPVDAAAPVDAVTSAETPGLIRAKPETGQFVETPRGFMVPYTETIPGTEATFEMIPVPGGKFLMGSPESEEGRAENEGPQVEVEVPPFWIGKTEVTWAEYKLFMAAYEQLKAISELREYVNYEFKDAAQKTKQQKVLAVLERLPALASHARRRPGIADAITSPTPLYDVSFTFELGEEPEQPAVTMTQYAAKQYTKWLSGLTGRTYRLPSEAEWEYAARAGSNTAFCFGDDLAELEEYAWYFDNSEDQMQPVATKKPNPWGLYDMHGNVAEWVLDGYAADHFQKLAAANKTVAAADVILWPTKEHPRVLKGGSWGDDPERCRSAVRMQSNWEWTEGEKDWKEIDPNLPKSPWWFSEPPGRQVGMRVMRPLAPMTEEQKKQVWEPDIESTRLDVEDRLAEGRGVVGISDTQLPEAVRQLQDKALQAARQ
jgi:formylglycine-generating enzyme required for sulfatase activity